MNNGKAEIVEGVPAKIKANNITAHSEKEIQAALYRYALYEKSHMLAITNSRYVLSREADFLSTTRAGYMHEFEIKRTRSDYRADFRNKGWKHDLLKRRDPVNNWNRTRARIANYFWFITADGLEIEPPEYAGWGQAVVVRDATNYQGILRNRLKIKVIKKAPLLHKVKINTDQIFSIAMRLSDRLGAVHIEEHKLNGGG